jgi:ABC-type long-subunit fatty acid transport system fused permease/ATPase subunit
MDFADDAVEAIGSIMRAVSEGMITPSEAASMATLVRSYTEAIDMADVVKRLDALEAQIKGRRAP